MLISTTLALVLALVQPPASSTSAAPVSGTAAVNAVSDHLQKHPKRKMTAATAKKAAARDAAAGAGASGSASTKAPAPPAVKPAAKKKPASTR